MIKVGVIGAGNRGKDVYAKYILNIKEANCSKKSKKFMIKVL